MKYSFGFLQRIFLGFHWLFSGSSSEILLEAPLITTLSSSGDSFVVLLGFSFDVLARVPFFWILWKSFLGLLFIFLSLLWIPMSTTPNISLVFIFIVLCGLFEFFLGFI